MKHIFSEGEIRQNFSKYISIGERYYGSGEEGEKFLYNLFTYLFNTTSKPDVEEVKEAIEGIFKKGGDIAMTVAEKLEKRGIKKGIKRGIEKGIEKGY